MKTAVVYYSQHHGNTKKVIEHIASGHNMTLINIIEEPNASLSEYDVIGFASGIYFGKFHGSVMSAIKNRLPEGKKVFFIYTCGAKNGVSLKAAEEAALSKKSEILGSFGCRGFDTFGPFKLIGGIAKDHPSASELSGAVKFYEDMFTFAIN